MSYTIDIYRKQFRPTKSLLDFSNFVAFFPQLVAGPIERAKNLLPQIEKFNGISIKHIRSAIVLIFLGYTKKVLISDNIAPITDSYFDNFIQFDSIYAMSGLILFSFQIYFDFSGYSDIARGIAKLFGIDLMINFNQPYFSVSPSEFWKRWHISLSTWLRDYLYIPLGGNRNGNFRTNINLMTTMVLGGLWHGASWNFVFWGGLHGSYLMMYKIFSRKKYIEKRNLFTYLNKLIKISLVYLLVLITWIPFRTQDFATTWSFLNHIIFWSGSIDIGALILIVFILFVLVIIDLPAYITKDHLYLLRLPKWLMSGILLIGTIGIAITMLIYQATVRPFIYFQF
jgi:D-alanyl-lipoteichoic acid acyltransferase DltB (MBOAT superfamily)